MSEISKPESGWQFLLQLLLAVITFTVIVLAIIFVVNLFDNNGPTKQAPAEQKGSSEYQDAMESKYYDPNSEGGEICHGAICN